MKLNLFTSTTAARTRKPKVHRAILTLEGLEERTVMSHVMAAPAAPPALVAAVPKVTTSLPLTITGVSNLQVNTNAAGAITSVTGLATGTLAGHAVSTLLTLTATPSATPGTCPVLNLELAPIHLNLLGLKVDTSAICLNVTGTSGPGNLLGNLVCDVANLLNGPATVGGLVNTLTTDLTTITSGLGGAGSSSILGLLNGALAQPATPTVTGTAPAATNVLNLSVGPVNLNLLGLNVKLDNCNNGPVTVKITAQPGPGNLLGNLISSLSHLLDNPGNTVGGILSHLGQISGIVRNARVA